MVSRAGDVVTETPPLTAEQVLAACLVLRSGDGWHGVDARQTVQNLRDNGWEFVKARKGPRK